MSTNHTGSGEHVSANTNNKVVNDTNTSGPSHSTNTTDNSCTRKRKAQDTRIRNPSADNMHRPLHGESVSKNI